MCPATGRSPQMPKGGWLITEAVEAAEVEVGRAVGQATRLDRVQVVDQEEEDVAVGGVEGGGVLRDVDARVVDARRPVEHARHLPPRVTGAVAGDALDGGDELVVIDAAVIGAGHGAKLDAAIMRLERLHLLGAVRGQAVLQVDAGERRRKLPQIGGGGAHQRGELAEAPVGRRDGRVRTRKSQVEPFGIIAVGLDPHGGALDGAGPAPIRAALHRRHQLRQGAISLVRWPVEPLGRHPPDPLASAHIHLIAAPRIGPGVQNLHIGHRRSPRRVGREPLSRPSTRHGDSRGPLTLRWLLRRSALRRRQKPQPKRDTPMTSLTPRCAVHEGSTNADDVCILSKAAKLCTVARVGVRRGLVIESLGRAGRICRIRLVFHKLRSQVHLMRPHTAMLPIAPDDAAMPASAVKFMSIDKGGSVAKAPSRSVRPRETGATATRLPGSAEDDGPFMTRLPGSG